MDAAREQLLAGSRLAFDANRQLRPRCLAGKVTELGHLLADINELLKALALRPERMVVTVMEQEQVSELELARQEAVPSRELARLERALHHEPDLLFVKRLAAH